IRNYVPFYRGRKQVPNASRVFRLCQFIQKPDSWKNLGLYQTPQNLFSSCTYRSLEKRLSFLQKHIVQSSRSQRGVERSLRQPRIESLIAFGRTVLQNLSERESGDRLL